MANSFVCVIKLLDVPRKAMKDGRLGENVRVTFKFSCFLFKSDFFPSALFSGNCTELRNLPEVVCIQSLQHVTSCGENHTKVMSMQLSSPNITIAINSPR